MTVHHVSAADLPALFRQLETARLQRVGHAMLEAAEAGVTIVARAAPNDQGEVRRSVHAEPLGAMSARILIDAPHAGIVELGSRPHWAPIKPLIAWVRRHQSLFAAGWMLDRRIRRSIARTEKHLKRDLAQTQRLAGRHFRAAAMALTRRRRYGFGLTKHDVFTAHASRGKELMSRAGSLRSFIRMNRRRRG